MDAEFAGWLPIGVLAIFCGLFLFAIEQPGLPPLKVTLVAVAGIACGLGITALALLRRFRPGRPLYVLAPDGIHIRWPLIKEILVPWNEIKGVDTIDIPLRHWFWRSYLGMTSAGATVFVVSKEFYDAHIHLDSFIMRGPGWHNTFVVRGDLVQCALHPEPVWADPRLLRKAVEERWLAFRDQPAAPLKPRTASVPSVIAGALKRQAARRCGKRGAAGPRGQPQAAAVLGVGMGEDRAAGDRHRRRREQSPRDMADGRADGRFSKAERGGGSAREV